MSRVALVQLKASKQKNENQKFVIKFIREARANKAELIAFPEFLMAYSPASQGANELALIAETINGDFVSTLKKEAKENAISVIATIYEKSRTKDRVYDTALLIDKNGKISTIYRKLHLYDALGFRESAKIVPGKELVKPIRTNIGIVGIMICYDVRFPEMARLLTLMGANVLVMPSAWVEGDMKISHWETMLKARAIENGCYVVAPNQIGNIYVGHSMVVDPFGRIILDMEEREGMEVVKLDNNLTNIVRKKLPLLKNRRNDIYSKYLKK